MSEIIKLKAQQKIQRKRVAAYCRVSTLNDDQQSSFAMQVKYYNKMIQSNPDWDFAGVFTDHGVSGTSIRKRAGFQSMLQACEEGKIDLILTKSIKRFARNTVDLLNTIRHLKDLGVEVQFEQERLSSLSLDGDFMLTVLASFAQDESVSMSENIQWAFKKKFENGETDVLRDCYGYKWDGKKYQIIPDEAAIVKRIFLEFLDGVGLIEIARRLNREQVPTKKNAGWSRRTVKLILKNVSYTGNVILQKWITVDPIEKQKKLNQGEADQYFVPDTHEAIISYEMWDQVQGMLISQSKSPESPLISPFKGKVFCKDTGLPYWHNGGYWQRKDAKIAIERGLPKIDAPVIPTYALQEAIEGNPGKGKLKWIEVNSNSTFNLHFTKCSVCDYHWQRHLPISSEKVLKQRSIDFQDRAKSKWTGKSASLCCFVKCGTCGKNFTSEARGKDRRYMLRKCKHHPRFWQSEMEELIVDVLGLDKFSEEKMDEKLTHCSVNGKEVTFYFRDGKTERRTLNG